MINGIVGLIAIFLDVAPSTSFINFGALTAFTLVNALVVFQYVGCGPARAYNTLVAFGPDGGRLAFYRKIHLFDAQGYGESTFIKPGPFTDPVVLEHQGVRFGLTTC